MRAVQSSDWVPVMVAMERSSAGVHFGRTKNRTLPIFYNDGNRLLNNRPRLLLYLHLPASKGWRFLSKMPATWA